MSSEKELYQKLKTAVVCSDVTTVRRLIKGGVCINDRIADFWFEGSLLHEAVAIGREHIVNLLLQAKPRVNVKDKSGQTPLHLACRKGHIPIVKLLLDHGANVNSVTETGRSCLHVATWQCRTQIATTLLHNGATSSINKKDEDGWTPFHWAARQKLHSIVRLMIEKGANVNVIDKWGQTPLHLILRYHGDVLLMRILLQDGADPNISPQNNSGLVTLLRQQHCTKEATQLLLQSDYFLHRDTALYKSKLLIKLKNTNKDLYNLISEHKQSLPHLSNLCRSEIRRHLDKVHSSRNLARHMQELPLPELLQHFVMLK